MVPSTSCGLFALCRLYPVCRVGLPWLIREIGDNPLGDFGPKTAEPPPPCKAIGARGF